MTGTRPVRGISWAASSARASRSSAHITRAGSPRREGYARVSAGERMTPAGSGPLVNIEHAEFGSQIDVNSFAAKLGFKIATA
jgi:hypothetical protein